MESEVFFLKYAFPCSFIIRQRREINEKEYKLLEDAAINNKILPRKFLEKVFFRAFERIEKVAKRLGKNKWDLDVLKEYFIVNHNHVIDEGMYSYAKAPDSLKNLCKVHKARVIKINKNSLLVEYDNGKTRPVLKELIKKVNIGDIVTIHYGYVSENLSV